MEMGKRDVEGGHPPAVRRIDSEIANRRENQEDDESFLGSCLASLIVAISWFFIIVTFPITIWFMIRQVQVKLVIQYQSDGLQPIGIGIPTSGDIPLGQSQEMRSGRTWTLLRHTLHR